MDGILNIYKEKGYTSHDVVAKLRGILNQRKIGHTGTLDPDATGVLPVCLGKATKVCGLITDMDKSYRVVCRLGVVTDTQDATGNVLRTSETRVTEGEVREVVQSFVGTMEQVPPMYSAVKLDGKRLYEYARQGRVVERKARTVTFHTIHILEINRDVSRVTMETSCSKGTYIRTLCHDVGEKLGIGACMEELERTRVGRFPLQEALTLAQVEELAGDGRLQEVTLPIDAMFDEYPAVAIPPMYEKAVQNGGGFALDASNDAPLDALQNQRVRAYREDGQFVGLYDSTGLHSTGRHSTEFKLVKLFYGETGS